MDLKKNGRVLYISSVDISIGNGPGANEREFTLGLYQAIGERAHFLIPRPVNDSTDLPDSVCTYTFPHRKHHPLYYPFHVLSQIFRASQLLRQRKFDLIVFRLDILPVAPYLITRIHRVPYALKTMGQGMLNVLSEKFGGPIGKVLAGINLWTAKKLINKAVLGDSVSMAQVDFLEKMLELDPGKIVWIDNVVNTSRFFPASVTEARDELALSQFDPIIGYVGTRPWERGGMQMIEVAPRLAEKYPDLGVVILGDGSELEKMKEKASELGVANRCVFTGYVPFHQVPAYVNSLDVGASISLRPDRSNASELKVRQYLACGKPVILSPGSNDFVIAENLGSTVPPRDIDAIAIELEKWLSLGSEEREAFSKRATKYMQDNLSIEAAVAKRLNLWSEKLLAK